jgi:aspartyl protease family protein
MRNLMILAAVLVGLGTYMAQVADKMSPAPAAIYRPMAASMVSASTS